MILMLQSLRSIFPKRVPSRFTKVGYAYAHLHSLPATTGMGIRERSLDDPQKWVDKLLSDETFAEDQSQRDEDQNCPTKNSESEDEDHDVCEQSEMGVTQNLPNEQVQERTRYRNLRKRVTPPTRYM